MTLNGGLVCGSLTVWGTAKVTHFVKATPYVLPLQAKECADTSTLPGVSAAEWGEEFLAALGEGEVTPT